MVSLNKREKNAVLFLLIPGVISTVAVITENLWLIPLCILSLFAVIGFVPLFRKRENLWMFIGTAIAATPPNLLASVYFCTEIIELRFQFTCILWIMLTASILLSTEEIILGIITRFIWKKQYRIST